MKVSAEELEPATRQRVMFPVNSLAGSESLPRARFRPSRAAGFSLIEVLVVMALILILTTMYWSSGSETRQHKQLIACQKNLQKIFMALAIYANDQGGKFPARAAAKSSEEALDPLVPRYTVETWAFLCPASKDKPLPPGESFLKKQISYAYYMGRRSTDGEALLSDRQVDTRAKIQGQDVFSHTGQPPGNNHKKDGGNVLFGDGHVDASPPSACFSLGLTQGVVLLNPRP
jgi:prepilin-type N-terminal cleavage/methylation domain-containing protein/prepilin-type processing-associated H-X9-DG protein